MRHAPSRPHSAARPGRHALLLALALAAFAALPDGGVAQDLHPSRRPSPVGIAKTHLGSTYVKVTYGRPYIRGRKVFGDPSDGETYLVPFGQVWRTGANEATEITVTGPVAVAGERLDAGTYAIFTVPGASSWTIRFSPQLGLDGTGMLDAATGAFTADVYDPAMDVLSVEVPSGATEEVVDNLTIAFEPAGAGADMVLRWERTEVRVPLAPAGA